MDAPITEQAYNDTQLSLYLSQFVAQQSDDHVKVDLELIHRPCGEHLCDIQAADSIAVLVGVCLSHVCTDSEDDAEHDAANEMADILERLLSE